MVNIYCDTITEEVKEVAQAIAHQQKEAVKIITPTVILEVNMIRIFCPEIDKDIIVLAQQIANKKQTDVMIESHDEYMEVHCEGSVKK